MSEKPKKYPADTPVTLQMIVEFHEAYGATSLADRWRRFIEPPNPEPKDGELWLCSLNKIGDKVALWKQPSMWCVYHSGKCHGFGHVEVLPIKRLIPAEGSDE